MIFKPWLNKLNKAGCRWIRNCNDVLKVRKQTQLEMNLILQYIEKNATIIGTEV